MTMPTTETRSRDARHPGTATLWLWSLLAQRRQAALMALELRDTYGAAAYAIARNSAQRGGADERRLWRAVARRLWWRRGRDRRPY